MLAAMAEASEEVSEREAAPIPGRGTPEGDQLRDALRAFDAGDYAAVRARTTGLADAEDPGVRDAATALREKVLVDAIQVVVLALCAAGVLAIVYVYF